MEALGAYILSVTATAVLCGILCSISGESSFTAAAVRLICGLLLTISVARPLVSLRVDHLIQEWDSLRDDGALAAQSGVDYAAQAVARLIKEKTEAYILDKAAQYDAVPEVEVDVTGDTIPIPCRVRIIGAISPYAKAQLQAYMETELGISREDQQWIS